jgi:DNA repair photolyase
MRTLLDRRSTAQREPAVPPDPTALPKQTRGRGARINVSGRYEPQSRVLFDDGWDSLEELPPLKTQVFIEAPKQIITTNDSPDISFEQSINPYRGCEHGCSYCFARPTHAYMGLSPGLDFESKLFAKPNAAELLRQELSRPGYVAKTIAIGTNTDPYQPIERGYRIMRGILEVLAEFNHPVGIVTKSVLVLRDLDLLTEMAKLNLVKVAISVTTLDADLARKMEPRASTPMRRLGGLAALAGAGIPAAAMVAPVIPGLNDSEIEPILKAVSATGVKNAGYVLLRLPLEVKDIFREWLMSELPDRASRVLSLIRQTRQGKEYDATFGRRMTGTGPYAWAIGRRFELACEQLGLNRESTVLSTEHFRRSPQPGEQMSLL